MNITVKTPSGNNSDKSVQTRFSRLWQDVQKKQKRNEKLRAEMEALERQYRAELLPLELELGKPLSLLIVRLIDFLGRKSLSSWQRHVLEDWIRESLDVLNGLDHEKARELDEQYNQALSEYYDMPVDELRLRTDPQSEMADILDELFGNAGKSGDNDFNRAKNPHGSAFYDGDVDSEEDHGGHDNSHAAFNQPRANALMNGEWIKNLFRRTAQALHPDKEQDPEKKAHKHQLMALLLDARDKQDVMALMQMYTLHVSAGDLMMAEEDIAQIIQLLEQQKMMLDIARSDIIHATPFHAAIYKKLYSAATKTRLKKFQTQVIDIRRAIDQQYAAVQSLRNLSALKAALQARCAVSVDYDEYW